MEVEAKKESGDCLCDDCHNDGCKCHFRAMRIVAGCNDFVNAKGEKNASIIYSTSVVGLSTDGEKGDLCKDCHNDKCEDAFRDCGSVIGCPMFMDAEGRQFHMTRESL
ncbi:MAG: hypothetical protein WC315_08745 [Candidatus Omnitrophota bacterium]